MRDVRAAVQGQFPGQPLLRLTPVDLGAGRFGAVRRIRYGVEQGGPLGRPERSRPACPAADPRDRAQHAARFHVPNPRGAQQVVEERTSAVRSRDGGADHAGQTRSAGERSDPGRIAPLHESGGHRLGGVRGAVDADEPVELADPATVHASGHADHQRRAQAVVPAYDGALRGPEGVGDPAERGAPVDLKGVDQTAVQCVEHGGSRHHAPFERLIASIAATLQRSRGSWPGLWR